jgi:hypothetical protein
MELEDQPWCPGVLRDAATDYLQTALRLRRSYAATVEPLATALLESRERRVVDLCSGGGGPWLDLVPALRTRGLEVSVCLTDKYPNVAACQRAQATLGSDALRFEVDSVDATAVPPRLQGFRTVFTAMHHFQPAAAQAVLANAVRAGEGIAVFDFTERSVRGVLAMLAAPLFVLALTPLIRPFRWSRLVWTYLVPLVPLLVLFDGIVSCLRTYKPAELMVLAAAAGNGRYRWESGTLPAPGLPITFLIGLPRASGTNAGA